MNKKQYIMIGYIVFMFIIMTLYTYNHEFGHKQIMLYNTCEEAKINIHLLYGETYCVEYKNNPYNNPDLWVTWIKDENLAHSLHETVGYHLQICLFAMLMMGYFYIGLKLMNN